MEKRGTEIYCQYLLLGEPGVVMQVSCLLKRNWLQGVFETCLQQAHVSGTMRLQNFLTFLLIRIHVLFTAYKGVSNTIKGVGKGNLFRDLTTVRFSMTNVFPVASYPLSCS